MTSHNSAQSAELTSHNSARSAELSAELVAAYAWSPTSKCILVATTNGIVKVVSMDAADTATVCKIFNNDQYVTMPCVAWSSDGKWIAVVLLDINNGDGWLRVYRTLSMTVAVSVYRVVTFSWNPFDANMLLYQTTDNECFSIVFETAHGDTREVREFGGSFRAFRWASRCIVTPLPPLSMNYATEFDLKTYKISCPSSTMCSRWMGYNVSDILYAPCGDLRCIIVLKNGSVRCVFGQSNHMLQKYTDNPFRNVHAAWSPDSARFFVQDDDNTLRVYEASNDTVNIRKVLCGVDRNVTWHPDGCRLAFTLRYPPCNNAVLIFNTDTLLFERTIRIPPTRASGVALRMNTPALTWSHDGAFLATHYPWDSTLHVNSALLNSARSAELSWE